MQAIPAVALAWAIFFGLLRIEPSTPTECVRVVIAGHHMVGAGRGRHDAFDVIAETGAAAQVWSEPVRRPFDSTYRGAALLAVRHGAWFGDHTVLGRQCAASGAMAPVSRDPHRPAGYVSADLAGAAGWRLILLTGFIELAVIFEGWRLWTRRRRSHPRSPRGRAQSALRKRAATSATATTKVVPDARNDKELLVCGWSVAEVHRILSDFMARYGNDVPTCVTTYVQEQAEGTTRVTFPNDIPGDLFIFLVNYMQYPEGLDMGGRGIQVVGRATLTRDFGAPNGALGQRAVMYIPANDRDYDVVYVRIANGTVYRDSFASRPWRRTDDPRTPSLVSDWK